MKIIKSTFLLLAILSSSIINASIILGNPTSGFGGGVDGWAAIMVIDENAGYTNITSQTQMLDITSFDFRVGANRGRVTPFIVQVNDAITNDFTILATGDTRSSGVDYMSTGNNSFTFSALLQTISLSSGDWIAPGFLDADANGFSSGSVIPFNGGDAAFLTGSGGDSGSGNLINGKNGSPTFGTSTFVSGLGRTYSFNIGLTESTNAAVPEPSILALIGLGLVSLGFAGRRHQA
jgi:hypothetical protein